MDIRLCINYATIKSGKHTHQAASAMAAVETRRPMGNRVTGVLAADFCTRKGFRSRLGHVGRLGLCCLAVSEGG